MALETFEETGQMQDKKRSGRPRKLYPADEQYLKVLSFRNRKNPNKDLTHNLDDASEPSDDPFTVH